MVTRATSPGEIADEFGGAGSAIDSIEETRHHPTARGRALTQALSVGTTFGVT